MFFVHLLAFFLFFYVFSITRVCCCVHACHHLCFPGYNVVLHLFAVFFKRTDRGASTFYIKNVCPRPRPCPRVIWFV